MHNLYNLRILASIFNQSLYTPIIYIMFQKQILINILSILIPQGKYTFLFQKNFFDLSFIFFENWF